jgi:ATP/maltotriose-dependent transcriptional regulator MalT
MDAAYAELVGRGRECERIDAVLDAVPDRSAGLVFVGLPGMGKSALLERCMASAVAKGFRLLSSRPAEFETGLVFSSLTDLFEPYLDVVEELQPVQQRAFTDAMMPGRFPAPAVDQRAIGWAVLGALRVLAENGPLLVAVDDLHWMDEPSLRVLFFVLRRLRPERIGFVGTTRPAVPLLERGHVPTFELGPLDESSIGLLLRGRLSPALHASDIHRIYEWSGGNPLFALELGASHFAFLETERPGAPVMMPPRVETIVAERVGRLPESVRHALLLWACLSEPSVELAASVSAVAGVDNSALVEALESGVVRIDRGRIRFTHPLFGSAAYWGAAPAERRRFHEIAALVVDDEDQRVRHLALAAMVPDAVLADALEQAAGRAVRRGAPEAAVILLHESVRLTPAAEAAARYRRLLAAADRHLDTGRVAEARSVLTGLLEALPPGVERAQVLHRLARASGSSSGYRDSAAKLRAALPEAAADPSLHAAIERDLANALTQFGALEEALVHAREAVRLVETSTDLELISSARNMMDTAEFFCGCGCPTDLHSRAQASLAELRLHREREHPALHLEAMNWGVLLKWSDQFDAARTLLEELRAQLEERQEEGLIVPVYFQLGELECWTGNLASAAALARVCQETAQAADQLAWLNLSLYLRALVDAERGSLETSRAAAAEALRRAERDDDARMIIRSLRVLGLVELSVADPKKALPHLERALALAVSCGYREPGIFRVEGDAIEAMVGCGDLLAAEALAGELEARGRELGRTSALAAAARGRALIASAQGQHAGACDALDDARSKYAQLNQPIEVGRTLLARGIVQRRQRQKATARDSLGEAARIFDLCGALQWAILARSEMARIGGRPPATDALAPAEAAVARLAVQGRANRQIAAELHMSVKTVEAHLSHVYRKLGVHTRGELSALPTQET